MTAPTRIGKYEIRRQIGRGAMGVVYEAFDPVIERRVAIKILRLEIFDPSQTIDVRTRFKREAQSAGQLAHPHIVTVHDYGEYEGTPFIVMEFLAGNELSHILGRGARLPLSEVVRLMTQLLGALSYAHERKVVHRDVKPGNIFILDDGSLKVVDFGLAHVEASNLTDTGALLGTPAYMSPEQFLALPIDERSDIFSAGVILYELLTGDKPFTGSVTSIMQKVLRQEPMEPSALNPTLSTAWDTVVKRAMAKKPDARFQTARQFLETIKQVFEKGAINVSVEVTLTGNKADDLGGETLRPAQDKKQTAQEQRPARPVSAAADVAPAKSSSKKSWVIAAIAVVAAVGAATLYQSQRSRDELAKSEKEAEAKRIHFDVASARKAGHTDTAILKYIEKEFSVDFADGRKTQSDSEILNTIIKSRSVVWDDLDRQKTAADTKGADELIKEDERKRREKEARDQVKVQYPNWEEIVGLPSASGSKPDTEYRRWLAKQPANYQSEVAESWDAQKIIESIARFKKDSEQGKAAQERAAQDKAADAKKAGEKAQAEKMATEKVAKAAGEEVKKKGAAEVVRLEKLRAEKTGAERIATEKVTAGQGQPRACPRLLDTVAWTNCVGEITFPSGEKYVGEYKDGKRNGQGARTYHGGQKYVGEFRDGKYNGQGTMTWPDGRKYVGEFKDDNRDGQGTMTWPDGRKYVGEWINDLFHGKGAYYKADGSIVHSGIFERGAFTTR